MMFESVPPTRQRLLLFARLPEHGHVKSRLAAALGADTALAIYRAMLRDILATLRPPWPDTEVEVLWTSANGADGASLKEAFDGFSLSMQAGRSLGDRLAVAFSERFFFHRTEKIIAIGVDDPTLPRPLMERAFALLDSCDWVIGPATDGGYYLIGCRNESFDAEVFAGIEWGTASVFGATTSRIGARNNTLAVLPPRSDIDLPADLEEFAREEREGALGELLRGHSNALRVKHR